MKITLTGRHVEITPSLRDFTQKKFAKLEELVPGTKEVHIVLSVEKYRHTAEASFKLDGRNINARKTTKDMYASIEELLQALSLQMSKLKDKRRSIFSRRHRTQPSSIRKMAAADSLQPLNRASEREEGGSAKQSSRKRFVRMGGYADKPMTHEEAALQLEDVGEEVMAFINSSTRAVNVIFKRQDGSFGLIEP